METENSVIPGVSSLTNIAFYVEKIFLNNLEASPKNIRENLLNLIKTLSVTVRRNEMAFELPEEERRKRSLSLGFMTFNVLF